MTPSKTFFHSNKKLLKSRTGNIEPCKCRNKDACLLNEQHLARYIACICIPPPSKNPGKTYLGTAEGNF